MKYNKNTRKLKLKKNLFKNVIKKRLTKKNKKGGAENDVYTCIDIKNICCSISMELMVDPVLAEDGHTYERSEIEKWFGKGNNTSPITNETLEFKTLVSNKKVKNFINEYNESKLK